MKPCSKNDENEQKRMNTGNKKILKSKERFKEAEEDTLMNLHTNASSQRLKQKMN